MKRILILLLAVFMLCGCSVTPTQSIDPTASPTPVPTPDEIVDHGEKFTVSHKKYDYNADNLVIVSVKNKSSEAYDVTLNASYLDENKNVIKTEQKTYHGFVANWSNNFIFYPEMSFDSFELEFVYELTTTPTFTQYLTVGDKMSVEVSKCLSDGKGTFVYEPKPEYDWYYYVNFMYYGVRSTFDGALKFKWESVVLDSNGDILVYFKSGASSNYRKTTDPNGNSFMVIMYVTDVKTSSSQKYTLPDNVKNSTGFLSMLYVEEDI